MNLKDCITKGKTLIEDYQWAMVSMDEKLMDKYCAEKTQLDIWLMNHLSEDEACEYFRALD